MCAALVFPVVATAQALTSELTVKSINKQPNGEELLIAATTVKPGDLLQYTAVYKNSTKQLVKQMSATLPIPPETEYVATSAVPSGVLASVDGKLFEPAPLKRAVKQADGKLINVLVPLAEYRFLRWPARDLAAGATYSTTARVRVSATASAASTANAVSPTK